MSRPTYASVPYAVRTGRFRSWPTTTCLGSARCALWPNGYGNVQAAAAFVCGVCCAKPDAACHAFQWLLLRVQERDDALQAEVDIVTDSDTDGGPDVAIGRRGRSQQRYRSRCGCTARGEGSPEGVGPVAGSTARGAAEVAEGSTARGAAPAAGSTVRGAARRRRQKRGGPKAEGG
jgi:hypothetical protein